MKKKNLLYIVCALAMGSLCGCDDFLNKDPQDKQTNDTYWQTETSLRTYAQDFYSSYFTRIWYRLYCFCRLFLWR